MALLQSKVHKSKDKQLQLHSAEKADSQILFLCFIDFGFNNYCRSRAEVADWFTALCCGMHSPGFKTPPNANGYMISKYVD